MDKIYIVNGCRGSYDDYHHWPVIAYRDRDKAEQYVTKYNEKLKRLKQKVNQLFPDDLSYYDDESRWGRWHGISCRNPSFIAEIQLK